MPQELCAHRIDIPQPRKRYKDFLAPQKSRSAPRAACVGSIRRSVAPTPTPSTTIPFTHSYPILLPRNTLIVKLYLFIN